MFLFLSKGKIAVLSGIVHFKKEDIGMKKILALCLSVCMLLTCATTTAFAAEPDNTLAEQKKEVTGTSTTNVTRNIDYWNTAGPLQISQWSTRVSPGAGENLKIHFYVSVAPIKIEISRPGGGKTLIANWTTTGHHWADLVRGTDGGDYWVDMTGSPVAIVDGGIYSEP